MIGEVYIHTKVKPLKRALLTVLLFLSWAAIAAARVPLDDGEKGMTCDFHFAAIRANWLNRGGDWLDAQATQQGDAPFARNAIGSSSKTQSVDWDVTGLANKWNSDFSPPGAILLRQLPGSRNGVINLRSREYSDPAEHPFLSIEWNNGDRERLPAAADTTINCTTTKSLGNNSTLKVGGHENIALVFPFEPRPGQTVEKASLQLHSYKQWHGGTTIGVYQLRPPWSIQSEEDRGLAAEYPHDNGIEADPDVFFATSFETRNWHKQWSTFNSRSNTSVIHAAGENGFTPFQGRALQVTLVPEQNLGLDLRYDFASLHGEEPEEVYFRYYLLFGDDWKPTRDGGKLPGFGGTYNRGGWGLRKANGENGWSVRGAFFREPSNYIPMRGFAGIGSYAYHMDVPNAPSENWGWGLGPGGRLQKNKWYSVEQYIRLNSPNQSNGIFKAWINGHLVVEQKELRFRTNSRIKVENVWFNVYHGGVAKPPHRMSLYVDNVVIARRYIGPMRPE